MSFLRRQLPIVRRTMLRNLSPAIAIRTFTKPSSISLNAEDEQKHREAYEVHRVEVEPHLSRMDETITFEHPKASFRAAEFSSPSFHVIENANVTRRTGGMLIPDTT